VLLSAALTRTGIANPLRSAILLSSLLAFSIISAIRSNSPGVNRVAETSSSAATICSGDPLKNVSSTCFTADRLAFSRPTVGT
jgi:hypothetical protein